MANQEHLDILNQGVEVWNLWRKEYPDIQPDLSRAFLREAKLNQANLNRANLSEAILFRSDLSWASLQKANLFNANLSEANLFGANFAGAFLRMATLSGANLPRAIFKKADLSEAILSFVDLYNADLSNANLNEAKLDSASFVGTNMKQARLTNCSIYGISAWNVELEGAIQSNLIITSPDEPTITIDNLEIAQFIYLLLKNQKIREVIDTITSKVVLILGRFTLERKIVLDALRDELRKRNYTPVLFDFDKSESRDITETVSTLAHMARFVIADITDAKSIPQELMTIVPNLPSVPVQPLLLNSQREYGMFEHFTRFPWVLPIYHYANEASLLQTLQDKVIAPAEQKAEELARR